MSVAERIGKIEASRVKRREALLVIMNELASQQVGCHSCVGVCCTFVKNSMMVTPVEAFDLLAFADRKAWDRQWLREKLQSCVKRFSLDRGVPSDGQRVFSRRTYTCPFFDEETSLCGISPEFKPYGCLGYNARRVGEKEGGSCRSDVEALQKREKSLTEEEQLNDAIRRSYQLEWHKQPIPLALLSLMEKANI